jgi:hypothetical protein
MCSLRRPFEFRNLLHWERRIFEATAITGFEEGPEKVKGCDIGYALTANSCEGANSVEACTVTALDAITAFAVPNPLSRNRFARDLTHLVDLPGPFGFSPAVEQTFVDPAAIANKNVRQSRLRDNVVGVRPKTCDVTSGWPVRTRPLARRTPTRG